AGGNYNIQSIAGYYPVSTWGCRYMWECSCDTIALRDNLVPVTAHGFPREQRTEAVFIAA
ncbi:hypothetical protein J6590_059878, partial [Homalodisca vitripennis]